MGIAISIIAGSMLLIFIWLQWIDYSTSLENGYAYIEFDEFKRLYAVDPDKWTLFDRNAEYKTRHYSHMLKFKFIDYIKYRHWVNKLKEELNKEYEIRKYKEFLEYTEMDLKKIKE